MKTLIKLCRPLPPAAVEIRKRVFVEEQGFKNEFDDIDASAVHFLAFEGIENAVGTCRVFKAEMAGAFYMGRLAVLPDYRGKGVGAALVKAAEGYVRAVKGKQLLVHAQCTAQGFYSALGYEEYGERDFDESYPHLWMEKEI